MPTASFTASSSNTLTDPAKLARLIEMADGVDNVPEPANLAEEIIGHLEVGLNSFRSVAALLQRQ